MRRMTVRDIDEERFFKIPKILNEDDYYKNLPVMARYLYGIMLDRFSLSKSRNWINKNNEVYFIFKQKALADLMNVSVTTIKKCINELKEHGLIESETTLTVNLYYISFPMPKTTASICPTSDIFDPTNSQNVANNSETKFKETEKSDTDILHYLSDNERVFYNLLESFSKDKFGKPLRQHNGTYDLEVVAYLDEEGMIEFIEEYVTRYEYANLDYIQTIQCRAM